MSVSSPSRAARLRAAVRERTVVLPGAFNALTARAIERAGFEALYLSGAALANSMLGVPDVGLTTLSEAAFHATRCAAVTTVPIITDADTGFGAPENTARAVTEFERAGLAGLHLEDQEFPKRCGHLPGKQLVPVTEFCEKLAAAVASRRDPDFMIIARTDARGVTSYDDAVARAHAYLAAGADAIFPEALQDRAEFERFARDVPTLLLANMTEFGRSPALRVADLANFGYRLVIFPVTLQRLAMRAVLDGLEELRRSGTAEGLLERMQTRQQLYDLLDYQVAPPPSRELRHDDDR
ncbi:MAG: isocitrate lyase/phosphoenolpyruvate mutase family protein [Phycisphaerales bacterium]|nr:isocitrate lyase/phosphoenolpyruvate mutase family protein [Phycisphaerales bacterium]